MKRFSDFAEDAKLLDGDKIKIGRVIGKEIRIIGHKIKKSKYKDSNSERYLTLQFELDGERRVLFTGSGILIEQMEKHSKEIPFVATIQKIDKFYTLT